MCSADGESSRGWDRVGVVSTLRFFINPLLVARFEGDITGTGMISIELEE